MSSLGYLIAHHSILSADYQVGAAIADRFPSIRLSLSGGYSANDFSNIFKNLIYTLGASLTQPLFEAGKRKRALKITRKELEIKVVEYHQSLLNALKEVEESFLQLEISKRKLELQNLSLENANFSLESAENQYEKGVGDFNRLLTVRKNYNQVQQSWIESQSDLVVKYIQLRKSLGGTWANGVL